MDCVLGESRRFTIFPHTKRKIESEVPAEPSNLIALKEEEYPNIREQLHQANMVMPNFFFEGKNNTCLRRAYRALFAVFIAKNVTQFMKIAFSIFMRLLHSYSW